MSSRLLVTALFIGLFTFCLPSASLFAQIQGGTRSYPSDSYYAAFGNFYSGEIRNAGRDFRQAARGGYLVVDTRWVDSICYHTMMGECFYQLGDLTSAVAEYDSALQLWIAYPTWMSSVEFPDAIQPSSTNGGNARITWGTSSRTTQIGNFSREYQVLVGRLDNENVLKQGGVIQRPELRRFNVSEICRCTALAIRRKQEILGPVAQYDKTLGQVRDALKRPSLPANHWARSWINIPLALALRATGDTKEFAPLMQSSLQIGNTFDHPLTATALLELGKFYMQDGKYDQAATMFAEATFSAAVYDQQDVLEEAFRFGTINHLISGKTGIYPPLEAAAVWANTRGSNQLQASLPILAAECSLAQGNFAAAQALLETTRKPLLRNDLAITEIGARLAYQSAHAAYQAGNVQLAATSLATAMNYKRVAGRWLYQLALVDALYSANGITEVAAEALFEQLLREPVGEDWLLDPMETLSVVLTPHEGPMQRWLELEMSRKNEDKVLMIADKIRRHRFFSSMPMGGRDLALRWILFATDDALSNTMKKERQELMLKIPALQELKVRGDNLVAELKKLPIVCEDGTEEKKNQKKLFEELAIVSVAQEAAIGDLALRREKASFVFPALKETTEIQQGMREGQLLWMFIQTNKSVYSCMLTRGEYSIVRIGESTKVKTSLTKLLKSMGHAEKNTQVSTETLTSEEWKTHGAALTKILLPDRKPDFWKDFKEVTIVPEGLLWYLPFEALPIGEGDDQKLLGDLIPVRYAPTMALAIPDGRKPRKESAIGVVAGKVFPKDDVALTEASFEKIKEGEPTAVKIGSPLAAPSSLYSVTTNRLIVLDDITDSGNDPYSWSPMQLDSGKAGSSLGQWMGTPWIGPEQLIIPGFHSAAESGIKGKANGEEVFVAVCGLMATGTRTILLSRWRLGGDSANKLSTEFAIGLKDKSATKAWEESKKKWFEGEVDAAKELRVKQDKAGGKLDAKHPFFWSGYMLIDMGDEVEAAK